MGGDEGSSGKGRRNARISLSVRVYLWQKRKKLIFFVMEKSYSIGKASSRLKIKLSTAKMIVKRYNTHGTFFEPRPKASRKHLV
jgi:transposase